jgi:hypothetical protein
MTLQPRLKGEENLKIISSSSTFLRGQILERKGVFLVDSEQSEKVNMESSADDLFLSRVNTPIASIAALPDYSLHLTRVHLVNARLTNMDDIVPLKDLRNLCLKVGFSKTIMRFPGVAFEESGANQMFVCAGDERL